MNFKGNTGKIITTEEGYVVIKQKSFAFGSYEKKDSVQQDKIN